jgi:hypothetical protein
MMLDIRRLSATEQRTRGFLAACARANGKRQDDADDDPGANKECIADR